MPFGDYVVVVEERTGVELARVTLTAEGTRPLVGEEVVLRGEVYAVRKVRHVPNAGTYSSRESTIAEVIVRHAGGPRPSPFPGSPERSSPTKTRGIVLPFSPPPANRPVTSFYLPPSLIAALVGAGYAQQETVYARARAGACLFDDGRGRWAVTDVSDPRALATRAAKAAADLAVFIHEQLAGREPIAFVNGRYTNNVAPERAPSTAPTLDDREGRTQDDRRPPTLRLVR
jgi:hypothetical protein